MAPERREAPARPAFPPPAATKPPAGDRPSETLNLERGIQILRRRWPLLALCVLLVAASAFAFSKRQTNEYTASASLLFRSSGLDQQASGLQPVNNGDPQRDAATNISLVKLGDVADRTARALGHGLTATQVSDNVTVSAEGQTDIAHVAATWPEPRLAAAIANTSAQQFINIRRETDRRNVRGALQLVTHQVAALSPVQRSGTQGQALTDRAESLRILSSLQTGNAELAQLATTPTSPSSPKVMRNTILGALLGLLLGAGGIALLERLNRRLNEPAELEEAFGLPLLAVVPVSSALAKLDGSRANGDAPLELPRAESEVFQLLRARLRYFNVDRDLRSILVTSAASEDGKSTVVLNLATAAASMGARTLVIEADLRKPVLGSRVRMRSSPGLADVLISRVTAEEAIQDLTIHHGPSGGSDTTVSVLVAGAIPPNPAALLESHAMETLIAEAAERYDLVLLDTPPLSVVSDAIPLLRKVDGVVIVSRLGKNTRDRSTRLRDELTTMGAPMLGVVANYSKEQVSDYYY